ncbi:MAG: N-acetylmuramoyl-L-alanine amidase [Planctomycetes bacterium]|nr:N-acetylmuramoyl-L-alanine amidase [Planctomycetota bacterium]
MRRGDEISACGQLFHTTARVVLWNDPGGYDAYRLHRHFQREIEGPAEAPQRVARFGSLRHGIAPELREKVMRSGWSLDDLREVVRQVVIHYDACGTSRLCFRVLHDERGLSCHFLLDLDGTIYQTLDLKERAWHAGEANDGSIGIEIANVGARSSEKELAAWYARDEQGVRVVFPAEMEETGLPPDFVPRPRRQQPVRGTVNGRELIQYDYTEEQYAALEKLLTALCRIFPRIRARAPRADGGAILDRAFATQEELLAYEGLLGHSHVTAEKSDPGPAFDWDRILKALREEGIP